jgi:cell division septation protein DedD
MIAADGTSAAAEPAAPLTIGAAPAPPADPSAPLAPLANELSYPERLQGDGPTDETLKPTVEPPPPIAEAAPAAAPPPVPETASSPAPVRPVDDGGFVVQVAALRDQRDADLIVKRLVEKGYPAYVLAPAKDAPAPVYRVQVGKFANLRDAEETGARLEKEERFKPWIRRGT